TGTIRLSISGCSKKSKKITPNGSKIPDHLQLLNRRGKSPPDAYNLPILSYAARVEKSTPILSFRKLNVCVRQFVLRSSEHNARGFSTFRSPPLSCAGP